MQSVMAINQADVTRLSLEAADLQKAVSSSKAKQRPMEHEKDQRISELQVHCLTIQLSLTMLQSLTIQIYLPISLPIQIVLLNFNLGCFHNVLSSFKCLKLSVWKSPEFLSGNVQLSSVVWISA